MGGKRKGGGGNKKARKDKQSPKNPKPKESIISPSSKKIGNQSVPGLVNLGNTCFFNAVMQSLGQSRYFRLRLEHLVATPTFTRELQLPYSQEVLRVEVAGDLGDLTTNLWKFFMSMQERSSGTLNPRLVFSEICKKSSRFSSHAQQDSQELLHYLLDALRLEEIHRFKHAILVNFGMGKTTSNKNLTDKERTDVKAYGRQAVQSRTFVDDVFGGTLMSTVTCDVCTSCNKVQESFLDLSLPVSDDKSMSSRKVGHQYRDKNKKNVMTSPANEDSPANVESSGAQEKESELAYPKKLSKHQKKEKRKAEKKPKKPEKKSKKPLTLSELNQVVESSSPPDNTLTEGDDGWDGNTGASLTPTRSTPVKDTSFSGEVDVSNEADPVNVPAGPEHPHLVDPATGEPTVPVDNREGDKLPTQHADSVSEGVDQVSTGSSASDVAVAGSSTATTTTSGSYEQCSDHPSEAHTDDSSDHTIEADVASNYASSGPQTDTRAAAATHVTDEEMAKVTGGNGTTPKDTGISSLTETEVGRGLNEITPCVSDGDNQEEESAAASDEQERDSPMSGKSGASVQLEPDSVEMSLKEFCATERLVGDNQFACIQCTNSALAEKRDREKKTKLEKARELTKEEEETHRTEEEDSNGNKCGGTEVPSMRVVDQSSDSAAVGDSTHNDGSGSDSEDSAHHSSVLSHEGSEQSEKLSSVDSEESEDDLSSIKFCDATKQLLLQTPPIVLTLHLKRFSHHGRQLKKNGKHIKFPFELDLSPYCMDSCKVAMCDGSGKMLYSLFGVVEHSGSMFGGHYVAYVKQRSPISPAQVEQICSWRASKSNSLPTSAGTAQASSTNCVSPRTPDNSTPTPDNTFPPAPTLTPDNTFPPTPDNSTLIPNTTLPPTPDNSFPPTPDNSTPTPDTFPPTPDNSTPTPDNTLPPTPDNSTLTPDNILPPTPDNSTLTPPDNSTLSHDNSTLTPDNTSLPVSHSSFPAHDISSSVDLSPIPPAVEDSPSSSQHMDSDTPSSSQHMDSDTSSEEADGPVMKEFDSSCSEGQWYYVSDSHVKTASPEEVQKSQAYLLFYELLPFQV